MVEKLPTTWKDFVGKTFFGGWRLLNATKRWYLQGFSRLPGTKPCKLRWLWAMYASIWPQNTFNTSVSSSSCFQEWPQTTLFAGFLWRKVFFSALGDFKVAQTLVTYTGSCGFLAQNLVNWNGFLLCTLQSGHKAPSSPPWRGSLSTATKHRQYQCFQLLQFARVASNHAMDRVFCGCPAKNLVKADCFSSV